MQVKQVVLGLAVILALAAPTAAHAFSTDESTKASDYKTSDPDLNHLCTGTANWVSQGGVSVIGTEVNGIPVLVYYHALPHGPPADQDPEIVPGQRMPGVLWLERNGLDGLQKNDWLCTGTGSDPHSAQVHPDQIIL